MSARMFSGDTNSGERLALAVACLTFYCVGTTYFEAFVNYRTWPLIGASEFSAYHRALTPLVVKVMLVPIALCFLASIALAFLRPPGLPRWAVLASLVLQAIAIASSAVIQVPIQIELDRNGLSLPLIDRLIWTDLWLRKLPLGLNALVWLKLLGSAVRFGG